MAAFTAPSLQTLCDGKQSSEGGEDAAALLHFTAFQNWPWSLCAHLCLYKCFTKFSIRFSYKSAFCHH